MYLLSVNVLYNITEILSFTIHKTTNRLFNLMSYGLWVLEHVPSPCEVEHVLTTKYCMIFFIMYGTTSANALTSLQILMFHEFLSKLLAKQLF